MLRSLRVLLVVVGVILRDAAADAEPCSPIPLYESGRITGLVCGEHPVGTVLDLDDGWVPGILSETAEQPQPYRATFVALANERFESGPAWDRAQQDRHFELFGIFPSFSVLRRRLFDAERHACHAAIEDAPLSDWPGELASWDPKPRPSLRGARRAAIGVLQQHLVCERLLSDAASEGIFDARTSEALALYQRLHMLPSLPVVDAETRETLLTPSPELDFRSLLRALRERVVDATGLLEDGSASNAWEPSRRSGRTCVPVGGHLRLIVVHPMIPKWRDRSARLAPEANSDGVRRQIRATHRARSTRDVRNEAHRAGTPVADSSLTRRLEDVRHASRRELVGAEGGHHGSIALGYIARFR